ncbi:MAG: helix-turn-helix transcriptional regulator [Roseburia sp.]|nr:helix-turn-helix transcriptional regulator [Roseburia sp.]
MAFGDNLLELLEERDISQKEFASMINIAKTTLNGYIKNKHEPDFKTVRAMASALNVSTDYLLGHPQSSILSKQETLLLERLRRMSPEQQSIIFDLAMVIDKRTEQKSPKKNS